MPLILNKDLGEKSKLGIWKINESLDDFLYIKPTLVKQYDKYKSDRRKKEVAAVQLLIDKLLDRHTILRHYPNGKPYLDENINIGISHTDGLAAVILSENKDVSVDVEYISDRVSRIKKKFMRDDENAFNSIELLLHWCVKETIYKLRSEYNLNFMDFRILQIVKLSESQGLVKTEIISQNLFLDINYMIFDSYIITYSIL